MSKKLFQHHKLSLAVLLFVACLVSTASAWKITHVHSAVGPSEQTTAFTATYGERHYVGGKAPTSGGLSTSIKLGGNDVFSCQTSAGQSCCNFGNLTNGTGYDFYSFVHVFSGVGTCWAWDKYEAAYPVSCNEGQPN